MNTSRLTFPVSLATSAIAPPPAQVAAIVPHALIGSLHMMMHPAMIQQAYLAAHHNATRQTAIVGFRRLACMSGN